MEYEEQRLEGGSAGEDEQSQLESTIKRVAQIVYEGGRPKLIDDHYLFYYEDTCEEFTIPAESIKNFINGPPVKWHDDDNNQIIELSFSNTADEVVLDNDVKKKPVRNTPASNGKVNTWRAEDTKILIDSFRARHKDLQDGTLRRIKELWEAICDDLSAHAYDYTPTQVENRWKTLERSYRRMVDHNKRFRIKKHMPFEDELKDLVRPRIRDMNEYAPGQEYMMDSSQDDEQADSPDLREYEVAYTDDVKPKLLNSGNDLDISLETAGASSLGSVLQELQKLRQEINNKEAGIRRRHEEKMNLIREHNTIEKRKAELFEKYLKLQQSGKDTSILS